MDKRKIARSIHEAAGSKIFVTQSQVCKITGFGKATVRSMLQGYDYIPGGRGGAKRYLVEDVAEAVMRL